MNFASDNWSGASAPVMAALARHSGGYAAAYGDDALTESITLKLSEVFEREVAVFFVATGTAANSLALAAYSRPGGVVFGHDEAHIRVDECGAPEFLTMGEKMRGVCGVLGKMDPALLREGIAAYPEGVVHHGQPTAVSLAQATECGTIYQPDEVAALKAVAAERGLPLHMDGARFGNALATLGVSPAEMTWKAGVDVLSFGGTKNGCWCAEAVVFFDLKAAEGFGYMRKRAGHLFSKSRFVAAQFEGYLENDNWLKTARHANAMATRLEQSLVQSGVARFVWPVQSNELFPIMKKDALERVRAAGATFGSWDASALAAADQPRDDEEMIRLVTSFATTEEEVSTFLSLAAG